ncbi:acetamidase/formamidase family protein [Brevundimonas lenta]|uniref:Acetamidase/formamidase n=1 Tax=Brevundimonas lenta TaxID=424796 RepID=A0A7W6NNT0_9CAUL|nr:acetamidase/formamidase family protein [Brevundimonas lenta]MBB4082083.1 acetamidase/formamidase [Brevundimonas lenta]
MRALVFLGLLMLPTPALASDPETWLIAVDRWGNAEYSEMVIEDDGGVLTGHLGDVPLAGRRQGDLITVSATDSDHNVWRFTATLDGDRLNGSADYPDPNDDDVRATHAVTGRRLELPAGPAPAHLTFEPQTFSNEFTAHREPVLVIRPGDVVSTTTLDSGGVDEHGRTRALYGNPQTGPFYVAGAGPGDVLAVRIHRLKLTRDWADSLDGVVGKAMTTGLAAQATGLGNRVRWRLDREAGTARLENPPERLRDYVVPVRPMLGGLGVAPDFGFAPFSTGDTGRFGGNMDFNGLVEGATVYLPVFQPGALLFLGDGHALQGDGETTQWALETSLAVEFSVEVLPGRPMSSPRIETADRITVIGQAGSLDDALRAATAGMIQWLAQDYGMSVSESSLVLGTAAQYRVVTLAGRNAGMALSLDKSVLAALPRK